jgi:hypothetical protein
MSSRIRNALNAGIAAATIGAAVLTLALTTPTGAFDLGVPANENSCQRTDDGISHAAVAASGPTVMNTVAAGLPNKE